MVWLKTDPVILKWIKLGFIVGVSMLFIITIIIIILYGLSPVGKAYSEPPYIPLVDIPQNVNSSFCVNPLTYYLFSNDSNGLFVLYLAPTPVTGYTIQNSGNHLIAVCQGTSSLTTPLYLYTATATTTNIGFAFSTSNVAPTQLGTSPSTQTLYMYNTQFINNTTLTPLYLLQASWNSEGVTYYYVIVNEIGYDQVVNGINFTVLNNGNAIGFSL